MARGTPALLSGKENPFVSNLRPISFARDDLASFDEALLQKVIDQSPGILPIHDFYPAVTSVCSLGREIPVDLGGKQGYIDNLLVTNDGHLVLVETKLYRNPEALREVIVQTLQYGMAVSQMPLLELEACIRRGDKSGALLRGDETIQERVYGQVDLGLMAGVSDNFEDALERYIRTGEILLLVVADGIHTSVERITHWMNDKDKNSPMTFGLVELKFFELSNEQKVVIPKTLLRTREVSRHVVIVDIRNETPAISTTLVIDDTQGKKTKEARLVKVATAPLNKQSFLQLLSDGDRQAAALLVEQLIESGLEERGTNSTLKFGFTSDGGEYHTLVILDKSGIWAGPLKKDADRIGFDGIQEFRRDVNHYGAFYREDQMARPDSFGCAVKYKQLVQSSEFVAFLANFREKLLSLMVSDQY